MSGKICFSKDLRDLKLLTVVAVCQAMLCTHGRGCNPFQKLFGVSIKHSNVPTP